jgi:hypothetical protein
MSRASKWFREHGLFLALLVGGLGLRLFRLGSKPLWSAEIQEIFNARCDDFYLDLKDSGSDILGFVWHHVIWRLGIADLETWSRLPSVLWGTVAIAVAWFWAEHFLDRKAAWLAALPVAVSVFLIDLSQTARWYAGAAVALNAATLLLYELLIAPAAHSSPGSSSAPPPPAGTAPGRHGEVGRLVLWWLAASVGVLSHAFAMVFLALHVLFFLYLAGWRQRLSGAKLAARGALLFGPVLPAAALQVWVFAEFKAKMLNHERVFLLGEGHGPISLLENIVLALSGGWFPFWCLFFCLLLAGSALLWYRARDGLVLCLMFLGGPILALLGMLALLSPNAFDITLAAFLFGPAYLLFAAAVREVASFTWRGRPAGLALACLFVALFVVTNGRLLVGYYRSPVKPVLGADVKGAAALLEALEPGPEDLLFFRYDEYFTHLAFYGAGPLQQLQPVAEAIPGHSAPQVAEYLHRLCGCADRPRVPEGRVGRFADLARYRHLLEGRAFLFMACPPAYPAATAGSARQKAPAMPDYAAWILSRGEMESTCPKVAEGLAGFEAHLFPGLILAFKSVEGRSAAEVAGEVAALFSLLPPSRLRLNPQGD